MKRRNPSGPLLRALSLVLMLALTFACGTAGKAQLTAKADGLSVLQQEQETLRQEKALVQAELDLLVGQQMTALEQKVLLDRQMNLTIAEMELVNGQIAEYEALISEKEEEAALCREAERSQLSAYMTRIRAMEEAGDVTYYEILFDATDFSDLLGRLDVIREIMECDSAMYRELTAAREATEAAEAALEQGKAELVAKQEELAALQAEQTARIEEAGALIAAIESDINEYRKYEEEIAGLEDAVQAQIDAIVAEMEQIREETTGGNTGGSGGNAPAPDPDPETEPDPDPDPDPEPDPEPEPPADSGSYIWPTACTLVTSPFGNRLHPIWNEWRMHDGIDIGAGYGEAIWAARAGEVITAAEDEGYGNYVVLYHSDGTTTLYAHMSEIHCSWGDRVEQGQVIGLVGTTGWTDGPHLHFEIRVNGSCVDPLLYLP